MAYADFVELYAEKVGSTAEALLAEPRQRFPMSTNFRGERMVEFLRRTTRMSLDGLRVLDVGCAYGGLSLALHQAGARVTGLDISPSYLRMAEANLTGVADIPLVLGDASGVDIRKRFRSGEFDLIVLNDVLEHIYDTTRLFENLDWLLSKKGVVYFKVPNGLSPRWALSEGHRKIFALSLMDPDTWQYLYPKRASVFYRPLAYFQGLFHWFGLSDVTFVDQEDTLQKRDPAALAAAVDEVVRTGESFDYPDARARDYIQGCIARYSDRFAHDRAIHDDAWTRFVYGSYFFVGYAARKSAGLKVLGARTRLAGLGAVAAAPIMPAVVRGAV